MVKIENGVIESPISKFLAESELEALKERLELKEKDIIFVVADKNSVVGTVLGALRTEIAQSKNLISNDIYELVWITEFPLFEYDEEENRFVAKHHPFTAPIDEDLDKLETDPETCRAKAYDIVINGYEVGGGSIRINNAELQGRMFKALGLSEEEANEKFGFLLEAFKYGVPPHGGIAYGMDRFTMIMTGTDNIKDVVAFPKTQSATCLMTNAPCEATDKQLKELSIKVSIEQ